MIQFSKEDLSRIIEMAWEDRTPFEAIKNEFGLELISIDKITNQDAIIIAVGHAEYCDFNKNILKKILKPGGIIIDVKSIFEKDSFSNLEFVHWRL